MLTLSWLSRSVSFRVRPKKAVWSSRKKKQREAKRQNGYDEPIKGRSEHKTYWCDSWNTRFVKRSYE